MCFLGLLPLFPWRGHHLDAFLKRVSITTEGLEAPDSVRQFAADALRHAVFSLSLSSFESVMHASPPKSGVEKSASRPASAARGKSTECWSCGVIEPSRHGFRHVWQMPHMWCNSLQIVYGCFALQHLTELWKKNVSIYRGRLSMIEKLRTFFFP